MLGEATSKRNQNAGTHEEHRLRTCALSRVQKPVEDLIRFVADPEGLIVPDLACRLPGRGVWLTATREDVAAAVGSKVFARGLKCAVTAPDDLADRVATLMRRRLRDAVSLANKAGLVVAGFEKVERLLRQGRALALLHAADGSEVGSSKLDRIFNALQGPEAADKRTIRFLSSAELSLAIGRSNVVHAASSGGGASQRIVQEAERLRRYHAGAG